MNTRKTKLDKPDVKFVKFAKDATGSRRNAACAGCSITSRGPFRRKVWPRSLALRRNTASGLAHKRRSKVAAPAVGRVAGRRRRHGPRRSQPARIQRAALDAVARPTKGFAQVGRSTCVNKEVQMNQIHRKITNFRKQAKQKFQTRANSTLFEACWRTLTRFVDKGSAAPETLEDVSCWLDDIACQKVNDRRSRYYIRG